MSFSGIPIVGFLSRATFSHNQDITTTYLVSHALKRGRSGSGSTMWNSTQTCELIPASPCHAMSGKRKIPKAEQRAESPREIRDCGLGEGDSLRCRCFSTCLCQGKGAFQGQGAWGCPGRMAGGDTAVALLGKEGSGWLQFLGKGRRQEAGTRERVMSAPLAAGDQSRGMFLDGKALPRNFCGDVGNKNGEWERDSNKAAPDPSGINTA